MAEYLTSLDQWGLVQQGAGSQLEADGRTVFQVWINPATRMWEITATHTDRPDEMCVVAGGTNWHGLACFDA